MAMATGFEPTVIGAPAAPVAVTTGVTVPSSRLATKAQAPFGATATASARWPTGVVTPTTVGPKATGVTPSPLATKRTGRLPVVGRVTATGRVVAAEGPPWRIIAWPVKTVSVDVPPESVTLSRAV